ncbi:hypothetical protein Tco_1058251 [Tanacetum coccineum]|uniref:Uncharacterized protein n=1 Tax=Tanacetum coccineum TaxID=301880 RepID=A0ABQ5H908_9ASTR
MSHNKTSEHSGGTSLAISPLLQGDNHDSRVVGGWSRIQKSGRANGVLSYFQLRYEGAASEGTKVEPDSLRDSQQDKGEAMGVEEQGVEIGTHERPSAPYMLAQTSPSPAFIKENIEVLRTMIKEHDQQGYTRSNPKKLTYDEFKREGSGSSILPKEPKKPLQKQDVVQIRRSGILEDQSRSKTKSKEGRAKSRSRRSEPKGKSSDSSYEGDSEDTCEDLSIPYKRPKPTPFTSRITHFRYHRRAKLPQYVKVYKGSKYLEDHFESSYVKRVPPVLRILTFIHSHGHPELAKKLNDKIAKIDDQMFERVRVFIRGKAHACIAEVIRDPQWEKGNNRGGWSGGQERFQGRSNQRGKTKNVYFICEEGNIHPSDQDPEGNLGHGHCKLSTTSAANRNSREVEHEQVL